MLNSYYPEIYDPANLKFKELELEDSIIEDSETALKLDFSKDIEVGGNPAVLNLDLNIVHEKLMWIKINHSTRMIELWQTSIHHNYLGLSQDKFLVNKLTQL